MKKLADYVHAKGLKIGIYSSPGPKTCGGYEGSLNHEQQDANTYARWGMDLVKYDWCTYQGDPKVPYQLMFDAIKATGRPMVYSLCQYGKANVWEWGASVGGNLWRTTDDIEDTWKALLNNGFSQSPFSKYAGPGHWNDPDMLMLGKMYWGTTNLTSDEQRSQVSLWSLIAAPLLMSMDMRKLDPLSLALLSNEEVIAVDQDPLGKAAVKVIDENGTQVWARRLADGSSAIGLFNMGEQQGFVTVDITRLGFDHSVRARNLWTHRNLGVFSNQIKVRLRSHAGMLLKIREI
jgi:alpha-galactosidase